MAHRNGRLKMKREERAKQFAPFKALDGYDEAIEASRRKVESERLLNEEEKDKLDRDVSAMAVGDMVSVLYFDGADYLRVEGLVSRIDRDAGLFKVVNTKIYFKDLYDLAIIRNNKVCREIR